MPRVKEFSGQTFHQVIELPRDGVKDHDIGIISKFYLLERYEFQTLSQPGTGLKDWARRILFIGIGMSFPIMGKIIAFLIAFSSVTVPEEKLLLEIGIQTWEIYSFLGALVCGLLLWFLGKFVKNEKDRLIDTIGKNLKEGSNG